MSQRTLQEHLKSRLKTMRETPSNQLTDIEKQKLEEIPGSERHLVNIHFFHEASIMLDL